ncbi:alpha-glucuronidase family glycosyl hydrolase [Terriglobus roseus]|nr:alpha-glucuronidase family glycosyl hydrolase [Terriglobus roseus]
MAYAIVVPLCSGQGAQTTAQASLPSAPVGWLRYAIPPDPPRYHDMPHAVVLLGDAPEENEAAEELDRGLGHMVAGTDMLLHRFDPRLDAIVLGTTDAVHRARLARLPGWTEKALPEEGFRIVHLRRGIRHWWILQGGSPRAELWAAYRFAALVAADQQLPDELIESPKIANRVLGIDWRDGSMAGDVRDTARLMASVGLNGLAVRGSLPPSAFQDLTRTLRSFGIRTWREDAGSQRTLVPSGSATGARDALPIREGMVAGEQMAGLGSSLPAGGGPQLVEFALAPGGVTMPALPMEAWQQALRTPERPAGTLLDAVAATGILARLEPEAAEALPTNPLLQANLYAFGRTAWDPSLTADRVVDEWARQTWGNDARVFAVAKGIVLNSAAAYVDLVSPMGLPPLLNDRGEGPRMADAAALADEHGIGVERAEALEGYPDSFAAELRDPAQVPDRLLLGVHRVPYRATLHSGKTVVQSFYDAHFAGASEAANALDAWEGTQELVERGLLDGERYAVMHALLEGATRRAEIWRESATEWLLRVSGVPDASGFVGSHPARTEAESMESIRYAARRAKVPEDASGGAASVCHDAAECSVSTHFRGEENVYRIEVGYFDETSATSQFELRLNGKTRAHWSNMRRPGGDSEWTPDGALAERFVINGIRLKPGDVVELRGTGGEAPLDFLEITRDPRWN